MPEIITPNGSQELAGNLHSGDLQTADQAWAQYVTFGVDGRAYGIAITNIREIKGWSEPTELPSARHAKRGVLNLRGVVAPIFVCVPSSAKEIPKRVRSMLSSLSRWGIVGLGCWSTLSPTS